MNEEWYDIEEIQREAVNNLNANKQYKKLYEQLERLNPSRDFLKINLLQTKIQKMKQDEINRLTALAEKRFADVNNIGNRLKTINPDDANAYQELMAAIALLLDMMDNVFFDINKILKRNDMGIHMEQFPELAAAKKLAWGLISDEQNKMPRYKNNLWADESERLYKHLRERCNMYRRKVDRTEMRLKNQNADSAKSER